MTLVIVESPTKARTIQKFLSDDYVVEPSFGHIRDLPRSELGVDTEKNFTPRYVIPTKAKRRAAELKKESEKTNEIILASDEDREGEAIAWHLTKALDLDSSKTKRIVFHEITKSAIEKALANPRKIDMRLVNAQQARRILDRLVGYKLSPFLWKKITRGLSAGRVQSVAVRLIADREREILTFNPEEYWSIEASLRAQTPNLKSQIPNKSQIQNLNDKNADAFSASLYKKGNETIPKLGIKTKEEADRILSDLKGAEYKVSKVERKEVSRNPLPPFTTSALQQDASRKFGMTARTLMSIAQSLYERGHITYHRTDSFNLSSQSLGAAKEFIEKEYGAKYYAYRVFKTKSKGAQEAHEAIRPAFASPSPKASELHSKATAGKPTIKTPEELKLDPRQKKLYDLIWRRFIASQMSQAVFDATSVDIKTKGGLTPQGGSDPHDYTFRANGSILKFDGFLKVYPMKFEENELPDLSEQEILELIKLTPSQHFTQPPARYSEATLIKELEKNGIGRPSTYAPIISTIQDRNYVEKNEQKKFQPTEIGFAVNDLLIEHFPQIVDINFTAKMEARLDNIAEGGTEWVPVIREFYEPFEKLLEEKYEQVEKKSPAVETDKTCIECGKNLVMRFGRFGKFYACSGFPECRHTEPLEKKEANLGIRCPKCLEGEIAQKRTKTKKTFYGCNRYPSCDFALWDKPIRSTQGEQTGERCEKCDSLMVEKPKGPKCSNKECK